MSLAVVTRRVRSCCQLCASSAALMEVATSGTWSRHFRRAAMAPAQTPGAGRSGAAAAPALLPEPAAETARGPGSQGGRCARGAHAGQLQQHEGAEARTRRWHRAVPAQFLPAPSSWPGDLLPGLGRTVHGGGGCCPQQVLARRSVLGLQHAQKVLSEAQPSVGQRQGRLGLKGQGLHGAAVGPGGRGRHCCKDGGARRLRGATQLLPPLGQAPAPQSHPAPAARPLQPKSRLP